MVSSTYYSRYPTSSTERTKLWDPSKTLGIINTDPGYQCITCIGYAPSQRRRCRNPIRADNREFITRTLNEIAYLKPDSPAVRARLREIAGPALCVRYHQNQAESMVLQWQRSIQLLPQQPAVEERRPRSDVRSKKQEVKDEQEQCMQEMQEQIRGLREQLARMKEERDNQGRQSQVFPKREEDSAFERREEVRKSWERKEREREPRRMEQERLEKERLEKERLEEDRLEEERKQRERDEEEKKRREQERAAQNERIRQRAQKLREDREREKREKELKEQEEWHQAWSRYQSLWADFRTSISKEGVRVGSIRDAIPWPVKSGSYRDVKASNVEEFMRRAPTTEGTNASKVFKKECLKWHPDKLNRLLGDAKIEVPEKIMIDMICRVLTELLDNSAGRKSDFVD
jgi:hypothetical protein